MAFPRPPRAYFQNPGSWCLIGPALRCEKSNYNPYISIYRHIHVCVCIYMRMSMYIHADTFIGSNQQLQEKSHKLMYVITSNPQSNKGETASARCFCWAKSSNQLCSRKPPRPACSHGKALSHSSLMLLGTSQLSQAPNPLQLLCWLPSPSQTAPGCCSQNTSL